ncbi:hypothetical protein K458DRAFT_120958 [Lentithecium fluviatile CBS 122367]|uniref:Uncharacterized protein n=1 Tax=Lentithecium fluviatile CBS 122367 TaxID=1168545 RepID=A0A6G1IMH7_9PLEO|nr:hypothetical protein K458DRAFT_120958 [Lentithecium fluviatile CBS 122367]
MGDAGPARPRSPSYKERRQGPVLYWCASPGSGTLHLWCFDKSPPALRAVGWALAAANNAPRSTSGQAKAIPLEPLRGQPRGRVLRCVHASPAECLTNRPWFYGFLALTTPPPECACRNARHGSPRALTAAIPTHARIIFFDSNASKTLCVVNKIITQHLTSPHLPRPRIPRARSLPRPSPISSTPGHHAVAHTQTTIPSNLDRSHARQNSRPATGHLE